MESAASLPFGAHIEKDRVSVVSETQRDWIKHRDEGAKLYVSAFPAAEKESY